jgi:hypothetical protein
VLERLLRYIAIVLSLIIVAGFGLFAIDEFKRASAGQTNELKGYEKPAPSAAGERQREQRDSAIHEHIDDANDILLKPFAGIVTSGSRWAQRGVPTLLGLLVYGFGIAFLARFARGHG